MADFQSDLMDALLGDSALAALISDRIWFDESAANAAMPFVVVYEYNAHGDQVMSGAIAQLRPLVVFCVYGASYAASLAVRKAIWAALLTFAWPVTYEDERSTKDMTTGVHRRDLDVRIAHA
jgi:hypothetical protein